MLIPNESPIPNTQAKPESDWMSPSHIRLALFLLATLAGTYLCFMIALPFLSSIAWAIGLSVLASPFQARLEKRFGHPGLCAFLCTSILGLVVVIPTSLAVQQLIIQAANGAAALEAQVQSGEWRDVFGSRPELALLAKRIESQLDLPGIARMISASMSDATVSIMRGSVYQLIDFGMTFYLLFFMLRDRELAFHAVCCLTPLTHTQMVMMFRRGSETISATVYGSFAVAAIQGLILGATFWWIGLPAPIFWGVVMAGLALAPLAGAFLVWGPAAFYLVAEGNWGNALGLVVMGILVIVVIDNLLRPVLVGKRLQTHTVLVFISVVGGLLFFGPSGLLLGPLVLTVTQVLLELTRPLTISDSQHLQSKDCGNRTA